MDETKFEIRISTTKKFALLDLGLESTSPERPAPRTQNKDCTKTMMAVRILEAQVGSTDGTWTPRNRNQRRNLNPQMYQLGSAQHRTKALAESGKRPTAIAPTRTIRRKDDQKSKPAFNLEDIPEFRPTFRDTEGQGSSNVQNS